MVPYVFANIITDISHLSIGNMPQATVINRCTKEIFHIHPHDLRMVKPGEQFSNREIEIIRLLASGLNSGQIGDQLFISKETVRTHRKNILKKAKLTSTSQLIGYAIMHGLIVAKETR